MTRETAVSRFRHSRVTAALLVLLAGTLAGCGGEDPPPPVTGVTVSSPASLLLVGGTAQLTASVRDAGGNNLGDRPVTWASSAPQKAQVTATGLVTALAPASQVVITATSEGVSGSVALQINSLVLEAPAESIYAGEARLLELYALDEGRNRSNLPQTSSGPSWSSASPAVAQVSPEGVVTGKAQGAALITARLAGAEAQALVKVRSYLTVADTLTQVKSGSVSLPPNIAPASVTVLSGLAGIAAVARDGSFQLAVPREMEGLVVAMSGGRMVGMTIAAPTAPSGMTVNSVQTAVSLVYLWPSFAAAPAGAVPELTQRIGLVPEVQALANLIQSALVTSGSMPNLEAASFAQPYASAIRAAERAIFGTTSGGPVAAPLQPPLTASGIEVRWPTPASANVTLTVQNSFARDVDAYLEEVDQNGNPLLPASVTDPFTASTYLGSANWIPQISSLSFYIGLVTGGGLGTGPAAPRTLQLSYSPDRSRFALFTYGAGVQGFGSDWSAMTAREWEVFRFLAPTSFTVATRLFLPVLEVVLGVRILGADNDRIIQTLRANQTLRTWITGLTTASCLPSLGDGRELAYCVVDHFFSQCTDDPAACAAFAGALLSQIGLTVDPSQLMGQLTRLNPVIASAKVATGFGNVVQTTVAIGSSQPRQEFDLSYHALIGAERIVKRSGDGQSGPPGGQLPQEIVVRVESTQGTAARNAWVRWTASGGGSVTAPVSTTDQNGEARVRWTLGSTGQQSLAAQLTGTTIGQTFTATIAAAQGAIKGRVMDGLSNSGINGATVRFMQGNVERGRSLTDSRGDYQSNGLPVGSYDVVASATGYVSATRPGATVASNQVSTIETIPLAPDRPGLGAISGAVLSATTGLGVAGATIELRSGVSFTGGTPSRVTTSASGGSYRFDNLAPGTYSLQVTAAGFSSAVRNAIAVGSTLVSNQDVVLSPTGTAAGLRIVLQWGASPRDLDAHLTGPLAGSSARFHVYWYAVGSLISSPFAALDRDDTTSYGPETITITQVAAGTYRYSVHDYSNSLSTTSSALSLSGATVSVYQGNALAHQFSVPSGPGTLWTVLEIRNGVVVPINSMSFVTYSDAVPSPGNESREPQTDAPLLRSLQPKTVRELPR